MVAGAKESVPRRQHGPGTRSSGQNSPPQGQVGGGKAAQHGEAEQGHVPAGLCPGLRGWQARADHCGPPWAPRGVDC